MNTTSPAEQNSLTKVVLSCMVGNALEWYDFVIYGYFSSIIGKLFFPATDPMAQLIAAFGVFWMGFLARPLGGVLLGHIGDHFSRKTALTWSIYIMAVPTTLIGCLPSYHQIGIAAPFLLMIFRLLQGLALGGEFTGSMVFLIEHSPPEKRGLMASWASCSLVIGVIVGSAIATWCNAVFSPADLESFGWRIPFFISILGSLVGAYMRNHLTDPAPYLKEKEQQKKKQLPLKSLFREHKSKLLLVIGMDFQTAIGFFLLVTFLANYYKTFLHLSGPIALFINTINMIVFCITLPIGGWLSDRYGRSPLLIWPCLGFVLLSYPSFQLFQHGVEGVLLGQMILVVLMGLFFGTIPVALSGVFPSSVRYSGLSLSHNVSMAVFGGSAPLLAIKLIQWTDNLLSPAYLLIMASFLSLVFAIIYKKFEQYS